MKKKEILWGLLFIVAAALIIVNIFGLFEGISMFDIVATVILSGIIIMSLMEINIWGILFPVAFICIIYAKELNITEYTPWHVLLIALLLCIGLSLIFSRRINHFRIFHHFHSDHSFSSNVSNEQDDNVVYCSANFGECIKYVNSTNFERADIKCSFGDVKVYFDHALIPSGKAVINIDVSFGDAKLYIPRTWKVINRVNIFLGDMNEQFMNDATDSPIVTIQGNISFGDAKIIYI